MSTDRPADTPAAGDALPGPARRARPGRPTPPPEVEAWAAERAEARSRRDWLRADALKATIEAAGWKVVDTGRGWSLLPALPPDVVADGTTRYGSAGSVPSVLEEPPTATATIVVVAEGDPEAFGRLLRSLRDHVPARTQVVVVGNDPGAAWDGPIAAAVGAEAMGAASAAADRPGAAPRGPAPDIEVVRTSQRLGAAAASNVGMRRARGAVAILAGTTIELTGDAVSPVAAALADPGIAVAGAYGTKASELPHLAETIASAPDAIDGAWLAFRREDHLRLGPLDERFVHPAYLDAWWSLTLRAGAREDATPRRAVRLDLPLVRHGDASGAPTAAPAGRTTARSDGGTRRDRLARRNGYRLLDRFRDRPDLLSGRSPISAGDARD